MGETHGDRRALLSETETLTYRQLDARASRYARWARAQGLGKGDAVCLMMANRPEYVAIWLGMARAGVATALINTNLAGPSLAHSIAIVGAKAAIVDPSHMAPFATGLAKLAAPMPVFVHGEWEAGARRIDIEVEAFSAEPLDHAERPALTIDESALFIYTSGTTGLPKAARITHSRALRIMHGFAAAANARADDSIYNCLPMYHTNGGVIAIGMALTVGGSCYIRERFSAREFWSEATRRDCTMFIYIGELCRYLNNSPPGDQRSRTSHAHGGRQRLAPGHLRRVPGALRHPHVLEFYAATEGNVALFNFDFASRRGRPRARLGGDAASRFAPSPTTSTAMSRSATRRAVAANAASTSRASCSAKSSTIPASRRPNSTATPTPRRPRRRCCATCSSPATLVPHRRPDEAGRPRLLLFRRPHRRHLPLEGRERLDHRGRRDDHRLPGRARGDGLRRRGARPRRPRRHGGDGRRQVADFDLAGLRAEIAERLPAYARPLFLRFRPKLEVTGTFKPRKVELVAEGFDPESGGDPVYFDDRRAGVYQRVDAEFVAAAKAERSRCERRGGQLSRLRRGRRSPRALASCEAAWRDLAARAGERNVFAEPDFLAPALNRLAGERIRVLLVWRDAARTALIGLAAIAPPPLPLAWPACGSASRRHCRRSCSTRTRRKPR